MKRRLVGFCWVWAILALVLVMERAWAESGEAAKNAKPAAALAQPSALPDSAQLVREVVYNELHDHSTHGYWRYWVERHAGQKTQVQEQIETAEGPVNRLELTDGHPLTTEVSDDEDRRLERLMSSPGEQAQHRREYAEDERRIGRILALLPEAFLYEPAQLQNMPDGPCYHLRFHPNPGYPTRSIESRIFHAMAGDLWVSVQSKHLVRLDGKLQENVDFGFGILGRLYKDGWFRLERTHATNAAGQTDWKTQRLEVHMQGRAILFKTIGRETSEVRGGFTAVPAGLSLEQAAQLVRQPLGGARAATLVFSR